MSASPNNVRSLEDQVPSNSGKSLRKSLMIADKAQVWEYIEPPSSTNSSDHTDILTAMPPSGKRLYLPPKGSLESIVCGAPANDVGSLGRSKEDLRVSLVSDEISNRRRSSIVERGSTIHHKLSTETLTHPIKTPHFSSPDMRSVIGRSVSESTLAVNSSPSPIAILPQPSCPPVANSTTDILATVISVPRTVWLCMIIGSGCALAIARVSPLFLGLICGGFMTFMLIHTYSWLLNPPVSIVYLPADTDPTTSVNDKFLDNPSRNPNESKEESVREFQGWMNLLEEQDYDPETYHISNTETVFVKLERMTLRMKKPLDANVLKRAVWNEPVYNTPYVKQIQIDMRNYVVELKPVGLCQSRLYNKRYPICLTHKRAMSQSNSAKTLLSTRESTTKNALDVVLLFSRSNKEKEEWFRRLDQASRGFPVTTMVLELQRLLEAELREESETDLVLELDKTQDQKVKPVKGKKSVTQHKETLFDRDHQKLLVDYIKYMSSVINKSSIVDNSSFTTAQFDTGSMKDAKSNTKARASTLSRRERSKSPTEVSSRSRSAETTNKLKAPETKAPAKSKSRQDIAASKNSSSPHVTDNPCRVSISECDTGTMWINALLQRLFFDFFREDYWKARIQRIIQKKLDKISLPYYLGPLVIEQLNLGSSLPLLKHIGQPYLADDGLWIDSQLAYSGGACMTIQTKINLNMLKKETPRSNPSSATKVNNPNAERDDDSDDSSNYEDINEGLYTPLTADPKKGDHAITKFFNRLKDSKYFQKLADTKLIKSAMDKVSKTPLKLSVDVKYVSGVFSASIPPPPTDRIWFGFRDAPELIVSAKPIVGEKSVNLNKLSTWIEEKLTTEFHKEFVIPNMIDSRVPLMCGNYRTTRARSKKKLRESASTNH